MLTKQRRLDMLGRDYSRTPARHAHHSKAPEWVVTIVMAMIIATMVTGTASIASTAATAMFGLRCTGIDSGATFAILGLGAVTVAFTAVSVAELVWRKLGPAQSSPGRIGAATAAIIAVAAGGGIAFMVSRAC